MEPLSSRRETRETQLALHISSNPATSPDPTLQLSTSFLGEITGSGGSVSTVTRELRNPASPWNYQAATASSSGVPRFGNDSDDRPVLVTEGENLLSQADSNPFPSFVLPAYSPYQPHLPLQSSASTHIVGNTPPSFIAPIAPTSSPRPEDAAALAAVAAAGARSSLSGGSSSVVAMTSSSSGRVGAPAPPFDASRHHHPLSDQLSRDVSTPPSQQQPKSQISQQSLPLDELLPSHRSAPTPERTYSRAQSKSAAPAVDPSTSLVALDCSDDNDDGNEVVPDSQGEEEGKGAAATLKAARAVAWRAGHRPPIPPLSPSPVAARQALISLTSTSANTTPTITPTTTAAAADVLVTASDPPCSADPPSVKRPRPKPKARMHRSLHPPLPASVAAAITTTTTGGEQQHPRRLPSPDPLSLIAKSSSPKLAHPLSTNSSSLSSSSPSMPGLGIASGGGEQPPRKKSKKTPPATMEEEGGWIELLSSQPLSDAPTLEETQNVPKEKKRKGKKEPKVSSKVLSKAKKDPVENAPSKDTGKKGKAKTPSTAVMGSEIEDSGSDAESPARPPKRNYGARSSGADAAGADDEDDRLRGVGEESASTLAAQGKGKKKRSSAAIIQSDEDDEDGTALVSPPAKKAHKKKKRVAPPSSGDEEQEAPMLAKKKGVTGQQGKERAVEIDRAEEEWEVTSTTVVAEALTTSESPLKSSLPRINKAAVLDQPIVEVSPPLTTKKGAAATAAKEKSKGKAAATAKGAQKKRKGKSKETAVETELEPGPKLGDDEMEMQQPEEEEQTVALPLKKKGALKGKKGKEMAQSEKEVEATEEEEEEELQEDMLLREASPKPLPPPKALGRPGALASSGSSRAFSIPRHIPPLRDRHTSPAPASTSLSSIISKHASSPFARPSGLSRKTAAKIPSLHMHIDPAPKKLAAVPIKKVPKKKSDLNPDDYSEGEWEEMEKERRKKEYEWEE